MPDWKITTQLIVRADSHEEAIRLTKSTLAAVCDGDPDVVIGARVYLTEPLTAAKSREQP
jgi:hypothetical protein